MTTSLSIIVGCVVLGVLYQRVPRVPPSVVARRFLGGVVLWFLLPALTFQSLWSLPQGAASWSISLVASATCLVCVAMAWFFYRHRLPRATVGALLYASGWSNATYLGMPILAAVLGGHAVRYAVLYDVLALTPLLFTLGAVIGVVYGDKGHRLTLGGIARQLITLPPLIAAIVGLLAGRASVELPGVVVAVLDAASAMVAPLMLISIGMALRWPRLSALRRCAPAAVLTLAVSPCVAWLIARYLLGMSAEAVFAVTLEAGMPAMILPMVFAERYGLDSQTLAEAIVITTVGSAVTLPIIATLAAGP